MNFKIMMTACTISWCFPLTNSIKIYVIQSALQLIINCHLITHFNNIYSEVITTLAYKMTLNHFNLLIHLIKLLNLEKSFQAV